MRQVWHMRSSAFETKSLHSRNSYVGHSILTHGSNHPRRRRGGQFGHEKRQRNFSRTGRRAAGMLLLTNQFLDLFECLSAIGHRKNFAIFLYEGVYLQTRPFAVPVWLLQESFLGEEFSVFQWKLTPNVYSTSFTLYIIGLWRGK